MENPGARIILLGRDLELRIISLIVRAREISQEVVFFDLGSKDETIELAEEVGCPVYSLDSEPSGQDLSKYILQSDLDSKNTNLLIKISDDWKLSDFPIVENVCNFRCTPTCIKYVDFPNFAKHAAGK